MMNQETYLRKLKELYWSADAGHYDEADRLLEQLKDHYKHLRNEHDREKGISPDPRDHYSEADWQTWARGM